MRTATTFASALLLTVLLATPARAEIDGFIIEGITEATGGFSLDSRIGPARDETTHVINIDDCDAYRGQSIDVAWGLSPAPSSGELYSVKLAKPGGSCPTSDLDDDGGETSSCQRIIVKRADPAATNNKFELELDEITGGECAAGTDEVTTVYIVYQLLDDTFQSEPIDFRVDLEPPVPPTNVEAFPGESSIKITWDDDVNTEEGLKYRVYYRAGGTFDSMDQADGSSTSGLDAGSATLTGLDANETYFFRVSTIDENDNEGDLSLDMNVSTTTVPSTDFWELYKESGGEDPGGFCFIATAAWGSPLAPTVSLLREFRDRYLMTNAAGRRFVDLYYELSPPLASAIRRSVWLAAAVRVALLPLVFIAWFLVGLGLLGKVAVTLTLLATGRLLRAGMRRRFRTEGPAMRKLPTIQMDEEAGRC